MSVILCHGYDEPQNSTNPGSKTSTLVSPSYPPRPLSLQPGAWLMETCVDAAWRARRPESKQHGLFTEDVELALAIAESYGRIVYRRKVKHPQTSGTFREEWRRTNWLQRKVDLTSYESTFFKSRRAVINTSTGNTMSDEVGYKCEGGGEGVEIIIRKAEKFIEPTRPRREAKRLLREQERVTEDTLNAVYDHYLAGDASAYDVLDVLREYGSQRIRSGPKEFDLKSRGADDLLGDFWEKMFPVVVNKTFTGEGGAKFSYYVRAAWANLRNSAYNKLSRYDGRFEALAVDRDDDEVEHIKLGHEDQYACDLHQAMEQRNAEDVPSMQKLTEHLTDLQLEILRGVIDGERQAETVARLNLSNRFELAREVDKIRAVVKRAKLRHELGVTS
jgi:hypothetical protein